MSESGKFTGKVVATTTALIRHPALVIDRFSEGQRGRYLNPFLYASVTAIAITLITSFTVEFPIMEIAPAAVEVNESNDSGEGLRLEEYQEVMEIVGLRLYTQFRGFLHFLLIPLLALPGLYFFREVHSSFYRHLIVNAYAVGLVNAAMLIIIPIWILSGSLLRTPNIYLYPATFMAGLVLLMVYNLYYRLSSVTDWLKALSVLIISYFIYSLIAGVTVAILSFIVYMVIVISQA